ncbi:MAG TPA: hypothetical protein VED66_00475 [Candidatus Sulfotelmatobacter sp.]|nr:hypothetical protein [Candidatus Sulfotelmatobacter sp.]
MNYRRFRRMGWMVSEPGYGMWGMAGWTRVAVRASRPARPSKQARRKSDDRGQQLKDSFHSDANEAEGQKE